MVLAATNVNLVIRPSIMLAQDAAEKALMKVATRGVVRLFNAVSKAQKQNLEESIVGKRAKVSF